MSGATRGGIAVPLVGEAKAGIEPPVWRGEDAIHFPNTMPAPVVNFPDRRYDPLYGLTVVGDSMEPLYRNGDVLFVAPDVPIKEGDRVVVRLRNNDVLVKVLKSRNTEEMGLGAINADHPDMAVESASVEWIARIVYATQ
ncbi:MAG: S24 family peptidase [Pseudomonadota bacterium]